MAKSKKQEHAGTGAAGAAAKTKAAQKPATERDAASGAAAPVGKKSAPAPKKPAKAPARPATMPLIDTSLAAQAAAKMVANRDRLAQSEAGEKREGGSLIKQLKQSLEKPKVQGPGGILSNVQGTQKHNTPFGGRKQIGHNQTFGPDANRFGVPRRTGG